MPSPDSDEDEELGTYQRKLREKANRSIQQLSSILDRSSSEESEGVDRQANPDADGTVDDDSSHQLQESDAVSQLRSLLQKQPRETVNITPSKRKSTPKKSPEKLKGELPAMQDLVPIIHNQSDYIRHLEAEVNFCKEELLGMKQRVRVVIVENERLHEEVKSKVVEESLKEQPISDGTIHPLTLLSIPERTMKPKPVPRTLHSAEEDKWRKELEQLKVLYQAQLKTLEAQVMSLKKDLATSQRECEEVKGRLRHRETMMAASTGQPQVGGLCLRCAQHEAVLAETHTNVHTQAIERVTKERDELMTVLCTLRASQAEAQQREWSSYQQVKQAVAMAEEANLEKTQAVVQCEQVRSELARQRERLEQELEAQQQRIAQARDSARHQANKEKEELAQTVGRLTQRVAELEGLMERGDRERSSLTGQLEEAYRKLTNQEEDNSKVCGELRYLLSQAQLKREEAERERRDSGAKNARQLELSQQEVERLGVELGERRQRLEEAQRAGSRAQAEAVGLEERLGRAEHQLHLTRQEKEVLERCRGEDVAALTFQWQHRELQLTQQLQQMETQHEHSVGEMDALLSSQNGLIGRLKEECRGLGQKLGEVTESSRLEVEQLTVERAHLQESVEKLKARCHDMEDQCVQHGRMHQRMKKRLQQLDLHCQSSGQQVMELLGKQNQLMQERQELAEEMQNLRIYTQTPGADRPASAST
ncbi:serologically defined colon cancer antigen 8 homolog [Clupea harengus]|uniref:Serologically defined colon cancer antigen 8 homolog n=1 Tax=Clupea harengus TaxID=7950 RepID=A0A6P8G6G6_CLUHA|nr:serologically defined colon cancer antigen 8 homolog [Clupea harengus]